MLSWIREFAEFDVSDILLQEVLLPIDSHNVLLEVYRGLFDENLWLDERILPTEAQILSFLVILSLLVQFILHNHHELYEVV